MSLFSWDYTINCNENENDNVIDVIIDVINRPRRDMETNTQNMACKIMSLCTKQYLSNNWDSTH